MTKPYNLCLEEWLAMPKPADKNEYCLNWFSHLLKYNEYRDPYQEYKAQEYTLIYFSLINEIVAMNRYRRS